jgi:hypothetical protein
MAETLMLSPLPRKAVEGAHSEFTSPYPASEIDVQELSMTRPFWYDANDQATQELRNVLGFETPKKMLPDWLPSFESRCLSSASTTGTRADAMSPAPLSSVLSPPTSPDLAFGLPRSDCSDGFESPTPQQPHHPPGALDKSSWLQARKVFVGGIPQSIDQNGLYHLFSRIGKVKKAWLQLFHPDHSAGQGSNKEKKHRGFGFVIFFERHAVDQLLGDGFSRVISFPDDMKLEVKRAIGKAPLQALDEQTAAQKTPQAEFFPLQTVQPPVSEGQLEVQAQPAATGQPVPVGLQLTHNSPLPLPQPFQRGPSQAVLVSFQAYVSLPWVPPFPGSQPAQQWTSPPAALPSPSPCPSAAVAGPEMQSLQNTLFQGFPCQQAEELKEALLRAMPDHYED